MDLANFRPIFGGHEKFVFRHGWLKKGIDAIKRDDLIFTREDAMTTLGVGKNMVRSIRHWCLATDMAEEKNGTGLAHPLRPTNLANKLLGARGWDPFFEDIGSIWLLHWQLVNNLSRSYVWNLTFSSYLESEFSKRQLQSFIEKNIEQAGIKTTSGTIEREVDCLLRTYIPSTRSKPGVISEESLDCPLAELDILRYVPEDNIYRFNIGPKASLPIGIFGYALLRFLPSLVTTRRTIAVDECTYHAGSPGQVFKLDENSVVDYLESLEDFTKGKMRLQDTAGLRQIYMQQSFIESIEDHAHEILWGYYEQK